MKTSKPLLIITLVLVPLFCLALAIAGVLIGFSLTSSVTASSEEQQAALEAEVAAIAADFAATGDLQTAQDRLSGLDLPNTNQYLTFMMDRYIQEGRDLNDPETSNLFQLIDALGATSPSMLVALATPTPVPTDTPTPTPTPPATDTPTPTPIPTDTPEPTATPVPPTDTPTPTPTLGPPTPTPVPTDTPTPTPPPVDFRIVKQRMLSMAENGGCRGNHEIFVTVLDVNGNPLDGVTVEDEFRAVPPKVSGEKGPGKLEYDLWKNGFKLHVIRDEAGNPATSEMSDKLSSLDHDIPNQWLIEGGYCQSDADCNQRKDTNQLCVGHYSFELVFQKTH